MYKRSIDHKRGVIVAMHVGNKTRGEVIVVVEAVSGGMSVPSPSRTKLVNRGVCMCWLSGLARWGSISFVS